MNTFKLFLAFCMAMFGLAVSAWATVDAQITTTITDATSIWDDVYGLKLVVLVALIGLFFLNKVRGR